MEIVFLWHRGELVRINAAMLETLRYIAQSDPKRVFAFRVGRDTLQSANSLTEKYLLAQLEQRFSTLDFYKSLLI